MRSSILIGVGAALLAALAWALNFIVPFVIGPFSVFDFALIRFVIAGSLCGAFLINRRAAIRSLSRRDWLLAIFLGLIGYLGYFLALAGAAVYAGPVVAPAILGLVPVVLGIAGNFGHQTVPWKDLSVPLGLATIGLLVIDYQPNVQAHVVRSTPQGVVLAIVAVALWTWFGLLNQHALASRPSMPASMWTALITVGAGVGMLAFAPVGICLGLFHLPSIGFGWDVAAQLYTWGAVLGISASIGGAWAWTVAAQRLPVSLAAQLIVMEAVFGTALGLLAHRQWPTLFETSGMAVLVAGVVMGVRTFNSRRSEAPAFMPE